MVTMIDVDELYEVYIRNLIRLCKVLPIDKITPFDRTFHNGDGVYTNSFISTREKIDKLSEDIIKNGMLWMFTGYDDKIMDGNHRLKSLHDFCVKQKCVLEFPMINLTNTDSVHNIEVEYPIAPEMKYMNLYGLKTKKRICKTYDEFRYYFNRIPIQFNDIFWDAKHNNIKINHSKLTTDYEYLMETLNNETM